MNKLVSVFVVIPVKGVSKAKSRLAQAITPIQRQELTLSMLGDVLDATTSAGAATDVLVISEDNAALDIAGQFGAKKVKEKISEGIDAALKQATDWCVTNGANAVLIFPADIPLLTSADVNHIISTAKEDPVVVISPSKREDGTNALLCRPPNVIPLRYGPNSFRLHLREAAARDIQSKICRIPRIALDIDTVEDLVEFCGKTSDTRSYRFIINHGIGERLSRFQNRTSVASVTRNKRKRIMKSSRSTAHVRART